MTHRPDHSFISTILRRNAELDREAGLEKCTAFDCVGGKDYTRTDGRCPWCKGTGYRSTK